MPKKVDANQRSIARELAVCGLLFIDIHTVGRGVPDAIVIGHNRRTGTTDALLVEIKTAKGTLTDAEIEFRDGLPEYAPYLIARDSTEILKWFGMV